jgi:hypothetical protein
LENIRTFEQSGSNAEALYAATENIKDLGLGLRRSDDVDIQEKLAGIAAKLGYEGEVILNQKAISTGVRFFPRYLNESLEDYPEYVDTRDPGRVKSHGQ